LPVLLNGKFQIQEVAGTGGMGVVYRATDLALDRKVAVKTLTRATGECTARLEREARAMARVRHPHLALIYGIEQWRGKPNLIVEYLEGGTLSDWLRRGPLTVEEALSIGIVLADVLDRIHAAGILHRDIKPSNIGYTLEGVPKLLDFGLVAALDPIIDPVADTADDVPALGIRLTSFANQPHYASRSGQLLGTLRYLSPEALAGAVPAPAADLWSLNMVLYEVLAGVHPFAKMTGRDTIACIEAASIPDVRDFCRECPANVAAFLVDALSVEPSRRPASAAALRATLQSLQT
jgi:serine/threonine protein kinase